MTSLEKNIQAPDVEIRVGPSPITFFSLRSHFDTNKLLYVGIYKLLCGLRHQICDVTGSNPVSNSYDLEA